MATIADRKEILIEDIMKTMEKRGTEELKNIYKENDVNKYSDEAFEAVGRLLTQRGEQLPPRDIEKKKETHPPRPKTFLSIGWRGLLISLIAWIPGLSFFSYRSGIEPVLYAEPLLQGIGLVLFLVMAVIAEKLAYWVKDSPED